MDGEACPGGDRAVGDNPYAQPVAAVREAEKAGRAAVDPQSDDELREALRDMWEKAEAVTVRDDL